MISLPNVTLICVDCYNYGPAVDAIRKSLKHIKPCRAIFLTDIEIQFKDFEVIRIPTIKTKEEYSNFMVKELRKYFYTSHCLVIQHDGYVLSEEAWDDVYLKYDYIGAPWLYPDRNVGNGGFSLRSQRLQMLLNGDSFIKATHPEDEMIGRLYRDYLEKEYDIKFAPFEVAQKFAFELREPICKTFGFHGKFHEPYKPFIVLKRTGAMGDVVMTEPVIDYFHKQGYRVALDTLVDTMGIFFNNPYRIYHVSEIPETITPERVINLDMSYEQTPKENVLKSYFKFCGIDIQKDSPYYRNAQLNVYKNSYHWLFEKYVVFHIDDTGIPHRNIHGINWERVERKFKKWGYNIIQVGFNSKEKIGTHFYTETKQMLMYLLAGAECVVGIDSGIAQLSVAIGRPTIIFTGSVNLELRYQNFENIEVIKNPCPSSIHEFCYHSSTGNTIGNKCFFDEKLPPCTIFREEQIFKSFKKITGKK